LYHVSKLPRDGRRVARHRRGPRLSGAAAAVIRYVCEDGLIHYCSQHPLRGRQLPAGFLDVLIIIAAILVMLESASALMIVRRDKTAPVAAVAIAD